MKRNIITIDENKCNGCGICIPNCHEGALKIINGKARLISDYMCDGLGACIGHCPMGAITIEEKESLPYDEKKVMVAMSITDRETIIAHLQHLYEHNEIQFLKEGLEVLDTLSHLFPFEVTGILQKYEEMIIQKTNSETTTHYGCPGSMNVTLEHTGTAQFHEEKPELAQWPVQLHLINPASEIFKECDLLLAADCVAYAIACPKLDSGMDVYLEKLIFLIEHSGLKSITILQMQVPCCSGLAKLVFTALDRTTKKIPVEISVVDFQGEIISHQKTNSVKI